MNQPFEADTPEGKITGRMTWVSNGQGERIGCGVFALRKDGVPIDDDTGVAILLRYQKHPCS